MTSRAESPRRRRIEIAGAAVVVIVAGLLIHFLVGGAVGDLVSDALYAAMVFLVVAFIAPGARVVVVAAIAYTVCVLIELFQLTGVPARLAETVPVTRLLLGTTFSGFDLLAYVAGVLIALVLDLAWRKRTKIAVRDEDSR